MDVNVNLDVPAVTKLVDYAASGIGSAAGPMLASWKARREAEAKRITALGDAEAQEILARGQSGSLLLVAEATAAARAKLSTTYTKLQWELDIGEMVAHKIQFQEEKRLANQLSVISRSAEEVGDGAVPDHEPDHDWTARFFSYIQDVSSEEMQSLWAKVLAGEIERPGSTSIRTLSILRNLDKATATLFKRLCSACVSIRPDGKSFLDARVPSLGGNPASNTLEKYGFSFDSLNVLNEHGLVISDYNSWKDFRVCIKATVIKSRVVRIPFSFQGCHWVLKSTVQSDADQEFKLSGVALTRAGRELSRIVDLEPMEVFTQDLVKFFESKRLQMTEVANGQPQV